MLVRLERADGLVQLGRVLPLDPRFVVTASPAPFEVVQTYTVLGIAHILTGFDHLLFVLALVILVNGVRRLIATVTASTVRAQPDAGRRDARLGARAGSSCRGGNCAVHRFRGGRDHPRAAGKTTLD